MGREQAGGRPALVLTEVAFNAKTDLAVVCPITSKVKGYPFEVLLPQGLAVEGAMLSDQLRSLDWRARQAKRIGHLPEDALAETVGKILTLIDPQ